MDFDYNRYLKGIEHLSTLYNAILYEKVLQIDYQPFENDSPVSLTIHPYYLKQYNNRWFLFGYFPEMVKYDWNLAIDRIVKINEIQEEYRKNTQVDWDEYFEDMVGVTKPEGATPEKVVLLFFGKTGKYMETKPIHGSQRSQWLDGSTLEIKLDVIINYELERFILSYADSVKVLQPQSLQKVIAERLRKAQKLNED
jgi:predicted DNA-binding transcriptional regulator YafY